MKFSKPEIFVKIREFLSKNPSGVLEILGATGSGKTDFSIEVAGFLKSEFQRNSEIISVDSRQIFRGISVASAKISPTEMAGIPHHGLDLCEVGERFSVVDFQRFAFAKISEIQSHGAVPILCGGTMLWLDAISENYDFSADLTVKSTRKLPPRWKFLKIGVHRERAELYERLNSRTKLQFSSGLIEEVARLRAGGEMSHTAATAIGVEEVLDFLEGRISEEEAILRNQRRNRNYAKRQLTWWRGREDVFWVDLTKN